MESNLEGAAIRIPGHGYHPAVTGCRVVMKSPLLLESLHAGLPFLERSISTPEYRPHRPVRIIRLWWERLGSPSMRPPDGRALIVRLDLPRPPAIPPSFVWRPHDLEVRWLGTVASAPYVVLEYLPLDLDDGIEQFVARVLPPTMTNECMVDEGTDPDAPVRFIHGPCQPLIVPLDEAELAHIEYELRAAVKVHPHLQESDLIGLRPSDVAPDLNAGDYVAKPSNDPPRVTPAPFGAVSTWPGPLGPVPIPEFGSEACYDDCIRERRLVWGTSFLVLRPGDWVPNLSITEALVRAVARPSAQSLILSLAPPEDPDASVELTVHGHVVHADQYYLALGVPDGQSVARLGDVQIVRVEPGRVVTVGTDEHRQVARRLIDALETGRRGRAFRPLALAPDAALKDLIRLLSERPAGHGSTETVLRGAAETPILGAPTLEFCRRCGRAAQPDQRFCGYCGVEFGGS